MDALRQYLEAKRLSQVDFAVIMGVSQPTISDWISGATSPSKENLIRLAEKTGLSLDRLLGLKPAKRA